MTGKIILVAALLLVGCNSSDESIEAQMDAHTRYLATEGAITDALNRPAGPDYAAAVGIVERSDRAPLQQDYDISNLMLASCRDRTRFCDSARTAQDALNRLYRVATTPGEDAQTAAGDLSLWFTRGAGDALRPETSQAACWTKVRNGKLPASRCPEPLITH